MLFMDDIRKIKKNEKYSNNFPSDKLDDIKILINENNSITELSKACGNFWKNADNNIKSKYEIAYKKSKNKYDTELKKYKGDEIKSKKGRPKKIKSNEVKE